jgi:hypothetical protein
MARTKTADELLQLAYDLTGVAGQGAFTAARNMRMLNLALTWFFRPVTRGGEGYGESEAEVALSAGSATIDLNALTPLKVQYRGILRPTSGADSGYLRASHLQRPNYADRVGASYDDEQLYPLPGIYWYETALDGQSDILHLRPAATQDETVKIIALAQPPQVTIGTDTVLVEFGWELPLACKAAAMIMQPNDRAASQRLEQQAEVARMEIIEGWHQNRDQGGPDSVYKYMRRPDSSGWSRYLYWV